MKLNGLARSWRDLPALRELTAALLAGRPPAAPVDIYHAARPFWWRPGRAAQPAADHHHPAHQPRPPVGG